MRENTNIHFVVVDVDEAQRRLIGPDLIVVMATSDVPITVELLRTYHGIPLRPPLQRFCMTMEHYLALFTRLMTRLNEHELARVYPLHHTVMGTCHHCGTITASNGRTTVPCPVCVYAVSLSSTQ